MESIIDEIHNNLMKNVEVEVFNTKYDIKENTMGVTGIVDEIEKKELKASENEKVKIKITAVDIVLYAIAIILGLLIIYGLYDIKRINTEAQIRQEQHRQQIEQEELIKEESQKQASLAYLNTSITDRFNREIKVAYPKEFQEVESIDKNIKSFKSDYDDTLEIKLEYNMDMTDLQDRRIEELKDLGINIYEFSDIIGIGDMYYYSEKKPNSKIYTYTIGCNCGRDTLVVASIEQSSTLITEEYVEDYIKYLDETLDY